METMMIKKKIWNVRKKKKYVNSVSEWDIQLPILMDIRRRVSTHAQECQTGRAVKGKLLSLHELDKTLK